MRQLIFVLSCAALLLAPIPASAQAAQAGAGSGSGQATAGSAKPAASTAPTPARDPFAQFSREMFNVHVELTISDQTGTGPVEKKTVSMIVSNFKWGKIRTSAAARPSERAGTIGVGLNVDAQPLVTKDGTIQLELTIFYNPLGATAGESAQIRPTELNQSLTVMLQSGKPLVVSQAADPVTDRKITVEVKATILK